MCNISGRRAFESFLTFVLALGALGVVGCGGHIEASPSDASIHSEGGYPNGVTCNIQASAYDNSCTADSDCVTSANGFSVALGDYCDAGCFCPTDTISQGAAAQYANDVAKTPWGMGAFGSQGCNCGAAANPCCVAGHCSLTCPGTYNGGGPSSDAEAAGGPDSTTLPPGSVLCASRVGPVDAAIVDGGMLYQCVPPQSCMQFNGGWSCCMNINPGEVICMEFDASTSR